MKYAGLIALAVVLIAIGPALLRNFRKAGKPKDGGGDAGPVVTGTSDRDDGSDSDGGDSDGGGDGGGD